MGEWAGKRSKNIKKQSTSSWQLSSRVVWRGGLMDRSCQWPKLAMPCPHCGQHTQGIWNPFTSHKAPTEGPTAGLRRDTPPPKISNQHPHLCNTSHQFKRKGSSYIRNTVNKEEQLRWLPQPAGGCVGSCHQQQQVWRQEERRRFLVSGGWVSVTQRRLSTAMPVPPQRGRTSQPAGSSPQLSSSTQQRNTLACSSEEYHYSALIQCNIHPQSPRRVQ